MANNWYLASALIGGTAGALDELDGADLNNGDRALVIDSSNAFFYTLDATNAATESSPDIISPDTNAGDKRWILKECYSSSSGGDPWTVTSGDSFYTDPTVTTSTFSSATGEGSDISGSNTSVILFGQNNEITDSDYNVIAGGRSNSILSTGLYKMGDSGILSGSENGITIDSNSDGQCVICGGYYNEMSSQVSSGVIVGGANNEVTIGYGSILGGSNNSVSGYYSSVLGGNYGAASLKCQFAFGRDNGYQISTIVRKGSTTDGTAQEIDASYPLTIDSGTTWKADIKIVARQIDGTAGTVGDSAFWNITAGIKNISGTTSLFGTTQGAGTVDSNNCDVAADAWSVAISADDTNDKLKIEVTGEADKDISWTVQINLVEVG